MGFLSSFVEDPLGTALGAGRKLTGTAADVVIDTTSQAFKLGESLGETLINTAGDIVDKAGNVVSKAGDFVYKNSQIFDVLGNLIVPAGKLAYDGAGNILDKAGNVLVKAADVAKDVAQTDAGKIAIAAALPTMGASLAVKLGLSDALAGSALADAIGADKAAQAVGTALASIGTQVAAGSSLESAVQNAGVSAVASTSSPYAANYINEIVKDEKVANAITSAGVSAAAGIALGNTPKNAFNYAIKYGPAATVLAPEIGKTAATGLATYIATQDAAKAATAAAGVAGAEAVAAQQTEKPTPATTAEAPPSGIQVAAADTGEATDAGGMKIDVGGVPIYKESPDASKVSPPFGYQLMSMSSSDDRPTGAYYDITQNAWFVPNEAVSELQSTLQTGEGKYGISEIPISYLGQYQSGAGGGLGGLVSGGTSIPGYSGYSASGQSISEFPKVEVTAEREAPETPAPSEVPVEDKAGKPVTKTQNIAIGTPGRSYTTSVTGPTSTLARALQGDFYPTSTTGLTAYRPAGEIESEETGKKRQDVWNEASLRLKDALGI